MTSNAAQITHDRFGDWMQTYTGRKFWPLDPRPEDFCLEDIAQALSMSCRFNGHCLEFYSVAEHSCHIFDQTDDPMEKKWAILHDAPEAYISDLVSPLKKDMPEFQNVEFWIMRAICERWNLPWVMPQNVNRLDKTIVRDELSNMRDPSTDWNIPKIGLGVRLQLWSPQQAKYEFLFLCHSVGIY